MIYRLPTRIQKLSEPDTIGLQFSISEGIANFQRQRTGNSHDTNATDPGGSSNCRNGIAGWHVQYALPERKPGIRSLRLQYAL